jgi:dihydroorotate dehydrogenase (fumarate)
MDLATSYLGLRLAHPFMPGASPLADDLDGARRLEDAGASAIVLRSLFEEQIAREQMGALLHVDGTAHAHAEALSYLPDTSVFALGPDTYLEHLQRVRAAVSVPVIASLNGVTAGGWTRYAELMERAGAHALELNLYASPTSADDAACSAPSRRW